MFTISPCPLWASALSASFDIPKRVLTSPTGVVISNSPKIAEDPIAIEIIQRQS